MHANLQRLYGESTWRGAEIISFLNACGICRSNTTEALTNPSRIRAGSEWPLLHFSIRFEGRNVVFRDYPRQIVVPHFKNSTSSGETVIFTPMLYDAHQSHYDLYTETCFEVPTKFGWLGWGKLLPGFLGIVPDSLLKEAFAKATRPVTGPVFVDLSQTATTVTSFLNCQYETSVRAEVRVQISYISSLPDVHQGDGAVAEALLPVGPLVISTVRSSTQNDTEDTKIPPDQLEYQRCVECAAYFCNCRRLSKAWGTED
ncbi:hypothetical protein HOY82DRAFT_646903 [Tuber indicum]|nr:hypothetical protein HOY82DRAFT_646903 [Tuber indicum]